MGFCPLLLHKSVRDYPLSTLAWHLLVIFMLF